MMSLKESVLSEPSVSCQEENNVTLDKIKEWIFDTPEVNHLLTHELRKNIIQDKYTISNITIAQRMLEKLG